VALIAIFGAISIIRHEYLLHKFDNIWSNEHAKKLVQDGIAPYRDEYLQYVRRGDFGTVNRFWNAGIFNVDDHGQQSDLHIAAEAGYGAIARGIIERGGDPKRPDRSGRTPLMKAAARGHLNVADVLLEHDCAINATSSDDSVSALYAAASNNHESVVDLLIKSGANLNVIDCDNMTPLMAAAARGHWNIAQKLISSGADLHRIDAFGTTIRDYVRNSKNAPHDIEAYLRQQKVAYNRKLHRVSIGHTGTGKVRPSWTTEPPKLRRK
jgi:ankyrin repeat protein